MADLVILGGGASGLMAAVSAARFIPGKNISILERGPRVGKKLLVTGNGRCNLTNLELDFSRYHGAPESFVSAVFSQLPPKDTLSLFGRLGLLCREEGQGPLLSLRRPGLGGAGRTAQVFRRPERRGTLSNQRRSRQKKAWRLRAENQRGSCFRQKIDLGLRRAGHALLRLRRKRPEAGRQLGLKSLRTVSLLSAGAGRLPCAEGGQGPALPRKSLAAGRSKTVKQETGEIQFTDQGLSGICILNLSRLVGEFFSHRTVNRHKTEKVELSLDLVPDLDYSSLLSFLQALISGQPRLPVEQLLSGIVNKRVGLALLKQLMPSALSRPCGSLSPSELKTICRTVKDWRFSPTGTLGWQSRLNPPQEGFCPLSSNPPPWSPRGCPGCMPAASFWISTETAAAIIYNGPGPPALSPGKAPRSRCFLTHSLRQRRIPDFALSKPAPPSVSRGAGPLRLYRLLRAPKPGSRRPETAALTAASRHGKISVSSPLRPALEAKACLRAASAGASGDFCYMEENTCPSCCVFCLPSAKRLLYRGTFMRRRFSPVLPLVSSAARPLSALTVNF